MVPNAFLHILGEDITVEENTVSIQEWEITKLAKGLPDRANTTVSKDLLTKKARLWQAQLEVIGDFLLPGPGVWWHWKDDGSVEFHDGPSEATHHPEGPHIFHFRSSLVKPIQTSLENAWKQYSEKPEEKSCSETATILEDYGTFIKYFNQAFLHYFIPLNDLVWPFKKGNKLLESD